MANRLFQSGNYIIAIFDEGGSLNSYELVKKDAFYLERNEEYTVNQIGGTSFAIAKSEIGTFLDAETGGDPYDEAGLLLFLRTYTGILPEAGAFAGVATDATLTGTGVIGDPLSVVPAPNYEEKWSPFAPLVVGVWHVVVVPGAPANEIVNILISNGANNALSGVRAVGSGLLKVARADIDSPFLMVVKTDGVGQIEVYTTVITTVFNLESFLT